jgi:hypothetical protein
VEKEKEANKAAAELQGEKELLKREQFFDELLAKLKERKYTFAEFLDYVFNPRNKHVFDWCWTLLCTSSHSPKNIGILNHIKL